MSASKPRLMCLLSAVALVVPLTACSNTSAGTPQPALSTVLTTGKSSGPSSVFGSLKACPVLDKALEGQGFTAGEVDTVGGDNGCKADKVHSTSVGFVLQPTTGIGDLNADPSKIHDGNINSHQAVEVRDALGSKGDCMIIIKVTETARASIVISLTGGTTQEACDVANGIAHKVEPQLPAAN